MLKSLKEDHVAQFLFILFFLFSIWWIYNKLQTQPEDIQNQIFGASYGVIALIGALSGLIASKKWGGMGSLVGKGIIFLSLGLLAQEVGQLIYSYYVYYEKIEIPYPSLGDIGYFGSIPLYTYGVYLMGKASGAKTGLRSVKNRIQAIVIPIIMVIIGYFLFLHPYSFDWSQPLKVLLDFGYPVGEAIYISMAILAYLLSKSLLGGIMKGKILSIIFALCVQFTADYTFLYQSHQGTYYAGGPNDYIYLTAYLLMSIALAQFRQTK